MKNTSAAAADASSTRIDREPGEEEADRQDDERERHAVGPLAARRFRR